MNSKSYRTDQKREKQSVNERKTNEKPQILEDPMVNTRMVFERYVRD